MLELLPLLIFFICFKVYNIYTATWSLMLSMSLVSIIHYKAHGHIKTSDQIILASVWLFGMMTLFLNDPVFLMWKPTFIFALFSGLLLWNSYRGKSNTLKTLLGSQLTMNEKGWHWLRQSWTIFFALEAICNAVVASFCSLETWVNFKVIGLTCASLAFIVIQMWVIIRKYQCKIIN